MKPLPVVECFSLRRPPLSTQTHSWAVFSCLSVLWSWRDYVLKIWSSRFWQGGSSRVLLHLLYILTPVCFWWSGLGQQAPHPCFPFGTFLGVFRRFSFRVGPLGQLDAFHMNISVGDLRIPLPPSIFCITECFLTLAVQMNQLGSFKKNADALAPVQTCWIISVFFKSFKERFWDRL